MSIQSNVNQMLSLAGVVAAAAGQDYAKSSKIKHQAAKLEKEFASTTEKAASAVEKAAEDMNPETAKKVYETLSKETAGLEQKAAISKKLFETNPTEKTAAAARASETALTQHRYSVEAAEEAYKSYTPEENKLYQQEKIAQKNREAFAAAEARRIRQSAASGTRYWQETYDPTKTYTKPQSQTKLH